MTKLEISIILLASTASCDESEIWSRKNEIGGQSVAMELRPFWGRRSHKGNQCFLISYRPGSGVFKSIWTAYVRIDVETKAAIDAKPLFSDRCEFGRPDRRELARLRSIRHVSNLIRSLRSILPPAWSIRTYQPELDRYEALSLQPDRYETFLSQEDRYECIDSNVARLNGVIPLNWYENKVQRSIHELNLDELREFLNIWTLDSDELLPCIIELDHRTAYLTDFRSSLMELLFNRKVQRTL